MPVARKLAVNPGNPAQFAVMWSNGRIDTFGGLVPVPIQGDSTPNGAPFWDGDIARDFQVIEWLTPSGYTLDGYGSIHPWGGASAPNQPTNPPWPSVDIARAFYMDPAGNGNGYILDGYGTIFPVTSAPTISQAVSPFGIDVARDITMDWTTKQYYIVDCFGRIYPGNSAPAVTPGSDGSVPPTWQSVDIVRAITVEWNPPIGGSKRGYTLDLQGGVHPFNGAELAFGGPSFSSVAPPAAPVAPSPEPPPPPIPPSNPPLTTQQDVSRLDVTSMTLSHAFILFTLDGNGHGYVDFAVPFVNVAGIFPQGPNPPVDGYWPLISVVAQDQGANTRVTIYGQPSQPGGIYLTYMS